MSAALEGGCDCGKVRYRLLIDPIVVNCCHCHACQRQTGSAFAINAVIEAENVELLGEQPVACQVPSPSGMGQAIMRCPDCRVAVWGIYGAAGERSRFVRAGTLDEPGAVTPHVHIFTDSKLPWVTIPEDTPQFPGFYSGKDLMQVFGEDRAARWKAMRS